MPGEQDDVLFRIKLEDESPSGQPQSDPTQQPQSSTDALSGQALLVQLKESLDEFVQTAKANSSRRSGSSKKTKGDTDVPEQLTPEQQRVANAKPPAEERPPRPKPVRKPPKIGPSYDELPFAEKTGFDALLDRFADQGNAILPSLASGAITKATGSAGLGALGGSALGGAFGKLGAKAGIIGMAATVVSEMVTAITDKINEIQIRVAEFKFGGRRDVQLDVMDAKSKASEFADPLQKLTGINLNPFDDLYRGYIEAQKKMIEGIKRMTDELSEFSGEISAAQADEQARRMQTDIMRAERMGPLLARFTRAGTESTELMEEFKLGIQQRDTLRLTRDREDKAENMRVLVAIQRSMQETREENGKAAEDRERQRKRDERREENNQNWREFWMSWFDEDMRQKIKKNLDKIDREGGNSLEAQMRAFLDPDNFINEMQGLPLVPGNAPGAGGN